MYAKGSGFTGKNKTERGALVFEIKENPVDDCRVPSPNIRPHYFTTSGVSFPDQIDYKDR
jgi:hypothetical protein